MQLNTRDCLAILRLFELADDNNLPREISRLKSTHPNTTNSLVDFRFKQKDYAILVDDEADDDQNYINDQLQASLPGRKFDLFANPRSDLATFGLPYKAKHVYLLALRDSKKRLDIYLAKTYPENSRSTWQKYVKNGYVSVNAEVVLSPKLMIESTDKISIDLPKVADHSKKEFEIIYIDEDVIVIDKPAGVLSHSKNPIDDEFTVADFFARYYKGQADGVRNGVVHRLDRDTSGVMIGARHAEAFKHLKSQFADRQAFKTYVAITDGVPKAVEAMIDLPIMRSHSKPGTFIVHQKGKSAQTSYQVVGQSDDKARLVLKPRTGRTHQLRVHMAYLKTPIVGDRLYGKVGDQLFLHAHQLKINLPSGQTKSFASKVPAEFDELVASKREE